MKKPRVIIWIEGGNVQSVHSDTEIEIVVADMDEIDGSFETSTDRNEVKAKLKALEEECKALNQVY